MDNQEDRYIQWEVSSWRDAVDVAFEMTGWLFRGEMDTSLPLTNSLERMAKDYNHPADRLPKTEHTLIELFQRQAHHYISNPPLKKDLVEWLSIMQHYGAPTRLLDFTESFYVAAFFALEDAKQDAVIWAFHSYQITRNYLHEFNLSDKRPFEEFARWKVQDSFDKDKENGVIPVRPWRLNQRMILQQGWFLCPLGKDISFEKNLCNTLGLHSEKLPEKTILYDKDELRERIKKNTHPVILIKFIIPRSFRMDAIADLRSMNITAATLFPGLDGFARSLRHYTQIYDE